MKLLEAIKIVTIENEELLERIYYALENRKDILELQEPIGSSDFFYEKWEEKYDEFCCIFDSFESIVDELQILNDDKNDDVMDLIDDDLVRLTKELKNIQSDLEMYQLEYGGLKRLIV